MIAPNHALTGALIGLSVGNPVIALPAAFLSHLVCDAIPHYDPYDPKQRSSVEIIRSKKFFREQIIFGGILCFVIVAVLAGFRPHDWLLAAVCAFVAASPDLLFFPRFLHVKRTGKDNIGDFWFWRLHHKVQWKTGPSLWWVEALWFVIFGALLVTRL